MKTLVLIVLFGIIVHVHSQVIQYYFDLSKRNVCRSSSSLDSISVTMVDGLDTAMLMGLRGEAEEAPEGADRKQPESSHVKRASREQALS